MSKYDFSRNAYKAGPKHVIVDAGTRREIARVHHEEDLQMVLAAVESHAELLAALRSIALDYTSDALQLQAIASLALSKIA